MVDRHKHDKRKTLQSTQGSKKRSVQTARNDESPLSAMGDGSKTLNQNKKMGIKKQKQDQTTHKAGFLPIAEAHGQ